MIPNIYNSQFTNLIMKSITHNLYRLILCVSLTVGLSTILSAQPVSTQPASSAPSAKSAAGNQTITFKVYGVCDECKLRIESAALDAKGVKKAEWDIKSNMIVVVGSSKMTAQNVAETIAKAGYKSELSEADSKAYNKLPACCQYDSGIEKH